MKKEDASKEGKLLNIEKLLDSNLNQMKQLAIGNIEPKSILIKFFDFDAMTQGLRRGDLIAFCGRPMMGKTSLALQLARNVAKENNLPTCFFGFEMSKEEYTYKIISMETGIDHLQLRQGLLTGDDWSVVHKIIDELKKLPIFIEDNKTLTIDEIKTKCLKIKSESKKKNLGLIAIDSYHMMKHPEIDAYQAQLENITRDLKLLAEELNVPILVTAPISREVENRKNTRPMLCDIRDSGAIEKYGDIVAMLYRDEYYDPDTEDRGIAEIIITKHKNGPVGTVKMLFEPQYGRYRNLAA